ncbi:APO protein 2 [Abeliophyllum distichum]|uniref:APO protein 2 n=1 Tax=Abeliophyllum distichum TaxID=126358 RepID=A0ABD1UIR1_9LAMI
MGRNEGWSQEADEDVSHQGLGVLSQTARSGPKVQNCGAHKHHQHNRQNGWQASVLDDLIPPRYVGHVPDINKPLQRELRNFYGQAPAVVEICVQWCLCPETVQANYEV